MPSFIHNAIEILNKELVLLDVPEPKFVDVWIEKNDKKLKWIGFDLENNALTPLSLAKMFGAFFEDDYNWIEKNIYLSFFQNVC